ncbi:hypothetical protein [Tenacibaculum sp. L6]|uniref:hypothetical protein n=1 Tax=Tenacibaculum sp. L6 TaxID=2992764 RepID=UPI00237C17C0|nr:hypothetical protein [Tenacibaculum sp. L6]MDE0534989.1 hypothetical protein [Tenacibaculum sp. L6]
MYTNLTSVLCVSGSGLPLSGRIITKLFAIGTLFQAASSSFPSIFGGDSTRTTSSFFLFWFTV